MTEKESPTRHVLEVWGDFACFTCPELKIERYSYPCPNPSAARGILDAILFKPEFYWQVERIELLSQPRYICVVRSEVKEKISTRLIEKAIRTGVPPTPIYTDLDSSLSARNDIGRTLRSAMVLKEPRFRIHARVMPRAGYERMRWKYDEQFVRRATLGKCYHQPSLGCREFAAYFRYVSPDEPQDPPVDYNRDLGYMLYDIFDLSDHTERRDHPRISIFHAVIVSGVLEVPPYTSSKVLKGQSLTWVNLGKGKSRNAESAR